MAVLTPSARITLPTALHRTQQSTEACELRHLLSKHRSPSIAELSARLYAAYQVLGGYVRLAGCALELRPIVHLKAKNTGSAVAASNSALIELFLGDDGLPLEPSIASELKSENFVSGTKPQRFSSAILSRLVDRARWLLIENCRDNGETLDPESIETEIIWRCFAEGKLRFTIGDQSTDISFADWAERLKPPEFICPETGVKTYRVAKTDDGRMAAAEEIVTCERTHCRMLRNETVVCNITGQRIAANLAEPCPITSEPVLRQHMVVCSICGMSVSPTAIQEDRCQACATVVAVKKSDPRMCLVLSEHPGLDRWRRWRLAETPQAYVLEARSLTQRLLAVVDKQSLEVRRLARRNRFQSAWTEISCEGWRELLQ